MECWFCPDCGTRLYHVPGGATYPNRNIKPGTLDDTSWLAPVAHFFVRSAQPWERFAEADAACFETGSADYAPLLSAWRRFLQQRKRWHLLDLDARFLNCRVKRLTRFFRFAQLMHCFRAFR